MKIVFLTRYFYPHIGGVEKQVFELSKRLVKKGYKVRVITLRFKKSLKKKEIIKGIEIIRFRPVPLKFIGLISIWIWMIKNIHLFKAADIIHAHSVLIWYWPIKLMLPRKSVYVTFHGWEGVYPIPIKNIWIRKIDALLSKRNITIHDYVTKWYRYKANKIMYTAVDFPRKLIINKNNKNLVYVGRLDEDTGLDKILEAVKGLNKIHIDFCGDGLLAKKCRKFGTVHGWVNPKRFLTKAFICLSPGVTSILEAFSYGCLVVTTYNNPVKKDYLLMTPFKKFLIVKDSPKDLSKELKKYINSPKLANIKINKAYKWVKTQGWNEAIKIYEQLWQQ